MAYERRYKVTGVVPLGPSRADPSTPKDRWYVNLETVDEGPETELRFTTSDEALVRAVRGEREFILTLDVAHDD